MGNDEQLPQSALVIGLRVKALSCTTARLGHLTKTASRGIHADWPEQPLAI